MNIIETNIAEIKIVEPKVYGDTRGYFFESWNQKKYEDAGIFGNWLQDNESFSRFGVLRGLHYQIAPFTQAKIVRVIRGSVLDIAVDIRKGSPTYGKHVAVELSGENKRQFFVPRGFAHGFVVLSDEVLFAYKCDNSYMPTHERGLAFDDPVLAIDWRLPVDKCILSDKDTKNPSLAEAEVFDFNNQTYL